MCLHLIYHMSVNQTCPSVLIPHLLLYIYYDLSVWHPLLTIHCNSICLKIPRLLRVFEVKYVKVITKHIDWEQVNNVTIRYLSSFSLKMQEGISGAACPSGMEKAEGHLSSQVISSANQRGLFSACLPLALDISKVQPWQEEGSTVIARCQVSAPVRHSLPSLGHHCFVAFVVRCVYDWGCGQWGHIRLLLIKSQFGFCLRVFEKTMTGNFICDE